MDSDEEAAFAAIIIATITGNIKRKFRKKTNECVKLGFQKCHIPMDSILSYFVSYIWRKRTLPFLFYEI